MARVILVCPPKPQLPYVFVVDRAVGEGCPNYREDVLLVQFFLRTLISAGGRPLAVNGIFGHETTAYIKHFQDNGVVREAGSRGGSQNNLRQIGLAQHNFAAADGSVRNVSSGLQDVKDGTSNTLLLGEQPPAAQHKHHHHHHHHYGHVRPLEGEILLGNLLIVRLNLAYSLVYGLDRFRRIDMDPVFPRELYRYLFATG
jgi:hypothetical protein